MKHSQHITLGLLLPLLAACVVDSRWPRIETQQWPAPMQTVSGGLETVALHGINTSEPGSETVTVLRYGDPVQVRPAGGTAAYPLAFHDKTVQLKAGSWVLCNPGGKVEILWYGGTSVIFSGRTTGLVGSPSRGEPTFAFVELDNALLNLKQGDQVRILGGAMVSADVGPLAVERLDSGVLRVENQSKGEARVLFRDADFELSPGQEIHLPLLSEGVRQPGSSNDQRLYGKEGLLVEVEGAAEVRPHPEGVMVSANGAHEIRAMGLRLQLDAGEELLVRGVNMGIDASSVAAPLMDTGEGPGGDEDSEAGEDGVPTEETAEESEDWIPVEEEGAGDAGESEETGDTEDADASGDTEDTDASGDPEETDEETDEWIEVEEISDEGTRSTDGGGQE